MAGIRSGAMAIATMRGTFNNPSELVTNVFLRTLRF